MYILFNDDAYKKIDSLIENGIKVDSIITDPPYNISKNNNFSNMNNVRQGIDFGEWDRGEFDLYSWIPLYTKLLNKNGSIIIFCSYRYISYIIDKLEQSNIVVKDIIVWQKSNPMPRNVTRRYVQDMEFAVWGVKEKGKWTFNKPDNISYLRSIYRTPLVSGKEKNGHPTQKSLNLMKEIIKVHTNPEDTILDPFMGSATTGEASISLGRKFIGIEKEEKYYNIAKQRLSNT